MDPVLSSLFPVNQIGSDGFNWWIGQVESNKGEDPKNSGRYKVRIVGEHLKDCDAMPTEDLPWANVMLPVNIPFMEGGTTGATVNLKPGCWVVGFYLDPDKQKPIIMGSIGQNSGATVISNEDPNPNGSCKSFVSFRDPETNPQMDRSLANQDGKDKETKANTDKGEVANSNANKEGGATPVIQATKEKWSETNPVGSKVCITIANPKCGNESNLKESVTNLLGDLLAANQASGGKIGDFYVSKVNGLLYDGINTARYHIGRVTRLVRSFIARIKSGAVNLIREGIEKLVDAILVKETVTGNTGPLADPEKAFRPVKTKGNRLKVIKKIFDKIFKALGCTIEDLTDRIAQWLTDFLWDLVKKAFSAAACVINGVVENIISKILSEIEKIFNLVLGPLQSILSLVGGTLNIIGGVINMAMSFLGISCSGPSGKCEKKQKKCTDGKENKKKDFLDDLIEAVEKGGGSEGEFVCDEAKGYTSDDTEIIFIGGVPKAPTPTIDLEPPGGGPDSFFPRDEDESGVIPDLPDLENIVLDESGFPDDTEVDDALSEDEGLLPQDPQEEFVTVEASPTFIEEGDTVTFTISTVNIPNGTELFYTISGVLDTDLSSQSLTGSFVVYEYDNIELEDIDEDGNISIVNVPYCRGQVQQTVIDNGVDNPSLRIMDFTVDDTSASVSVTINSDIQVIPGIEDDVVAVPTYVISTEKTQYLPGEDIIFNIIGTDVEDNTVEEYVLYGELNPSDFIPEKLEGEFKVKDNQSTVIVGIKDEIEIDVKKKLTFSIKGTEAEHFVYIVNEILEDPNQVYLDDGSIQETETTTYPDGNYNTEVTITSPETIDDEALDPDINQPVAGDAITDDNGSIISIPVLDKGSPYDEAPFVIIAGEGSGATGIALLDRDGFVSEIRVTRSGIGYKVNKADDNNLKCVIDSFTLIAPGLGYTSKPKVYVNGEEGIGEAVINDEGLLISVKLLRRTDTYTEMPRVIIMGGGGVGAMVLPSMVCLEPEDLERRGSVKIGTGTYIDCP